MKHALLVIALALSACSGIAPRSGAAAVVTVSGVVEKVCRECSEALVVAPGGGTGGLVWDVVTVRITSPKRLAGSSMSVSVLFESAAQRETYLEGHAIAFPATPDKLEERRVMLGPQDLGGG